MGYEREVYANAPLVYVAFEARFPLAPTLTDDAALAQLTDAFSATLPVPDIAPLLTARDAASGVGPERLLRFMSRERMSSVTVTRTSLSVETTAYDQWPSFRELVMNAVETVAGLVRVAGVERVGLRYIDEIRVPNDIPDAAGWSGWVADDVLGHFSLVPEMAVESFTTEATFVGEFGRMVVRYAALHGPGVVSDEPLRRAIPAAEGPFFVIDADSFRDAPGDGMLDFTAEVIGNAVDQLHSPLGVLFQSTITDRSRELFRGNA